MDVQRVVTNETCNENCSFSNTRRPAERPDFACWPRAGITPIFAGSHTDVVPRTTPLIPSFTDIFPSRTRGLESARAAGIGGVRRGYAELYRTVELQPFPAGTDATTAS